MTMDQVKYEYDRINEAFDVNSPLEELVTSIKRMHRQRFLVIWHDTSCVSNHSHLLMMISVLYDTAIFYTDTEFKDKTGETLMYLRNLLNNTTIYLGILSSIVYL